MEIRPLQSFLAGTIEKSKFLICSTPIYLLLIYVIVSRLIPLAMLFPGIKRNKYSSIFVIDRRLYFLRF